MKAKPIVILGGCLVVALVVLLPPYIRVRPPCMQPGCISNLRQIQGGKEYWAFEFHKSTNDVPTWKDLTPYLRGTLSCPQGGTYTIGRVADTPTCSFPGHVLK